MARYIPIITAAQQNPSPGWPQQHAAMNGSSVIPTFQPSLGSESEDVLPIGAIYIFILKTTLAHVHIVDVDERDDAIFDRFYAAYVMIRKPRFSRFSFARKAPGTTEISPATVECKHAENHHDRNRRLSERFTKTGYIPWMQN